MRLILWSNLEQNFLIWLNPRISTPCENRVPDGSRSHKGNLGRVKAVTSNRERTLWLSQSGLLFCMSVEAILPHKFFARTPQSTDFCFFVTMSSTPSDSEMTWLRRRWNVLYRWRHEVGFTMKTKLIYFRWLPSLWLTMNGESNTRGWMLGKNSNELWRTDSKAKM